ncbi:phage tail protein [Roseobacter sp. YSTF-M11]|uniref:Phage tail protein n=1 Tax=Roseobacter insulae TaxID=2859783 RepID=A0A9X1JYX2_9RHOB|nr:phage tail protein [Roseobacter insulae]MBW4708615.1 phage tail protein [Roseobacter insulae]
MGKVVKAVGAIAAGFATGGLGFAVGGIGSFLTTTFVGRLLTTVAFSALRAALTRKSGGSAGPQPGIRTAQTQTGGTNPASFILGTYATEGTLACPPMSHGTAGGVPNAYLTYVIELGDVPGQTLEGMIVDGETVSLGATPHADYGLPFEGRFAGHGWVRFYDGSQTVADPMLLAKYGTHPDRPWTAAMVGRGINYAIVTFRYNRTIYSSFPKVRFVLGGIPLYDPRLDDTVGGVGAHRYDDRSTWAQTDNAAVLIYNIKRGIDIGGGYIWGGGSEAADLPLANWWAQMNNADLAMALDAGGTEPQYRAAYEVFVDDEPASVIEEVLNACSGELAENGGIWKLRLGGPGLPVYFFTDDDVIVTESEEHTPYAIEQEPFNGVSVVYPDPAALWEPRDAPARYNAEYALADPSQRRVADLTLSAAPYPNQVQRIMRAYVEEERRVIRHVLTLPQDALVLEPLDVVSWTSDRHGYAAKAFEVDTMIDPLLTGTPRLTLKERDPDDAAWLPAYELPTPNLPTSVTDLPPQTVDGFAVTAVAIEDENDAPARPAIRIVWTGDQEDVRGVQFEIEAADGTSIVKASALDVAGGAHVVAEGILPNKDYRVRARFVVFRPTVWTAWEPVTTLDLRLRPEDLDAPAFQVNGMAIFGGVLQSDNFVSGVSGWQINRNGSMELQDLVAREWIQIGAVTDFNEIVLPGAAYRYNAVHAEFFFGPSGNGQVSHVNASFQVHRAGLYQFVQQTGDGPQTITRVVPSQAFLQIRYLNGGVWSGFGNVLISPVAAGGWIAQSTIFHVQGPFDSAHLRLYIGITTSDVPTSPENNVQAVTLGAQVTTR